MCSARDRVASVSDTVDDINPASFSRGPTVDGIIRFRV